MPEGAAPSDDEEIDERPLDDPHRALNINLDLWVIELFYFEKSIKSSMRTETLIIFDNTIKNILFWESLPSKQ